MTVYQVWSWDAWASSKGKEYLEGTYLHQADATARVKELNDQARIDWMAHCDPSCVENYRDQAYVQIVTVK